MSEVAAMTHTRRRLILRGGAIAGVVGGVVISLLAAVTNALRGQDVWRVFKVAAYPFLHQRVTSPGFDAVPIALGLVDHFAVSIICGILFADLAFGLSRWATVGFGAVWGLLVLFAMTYLVLPMAGAVRLEDQMAIGPMVVEHVMFGIAVGLAFVPFQRLEARPTHRWAPGRRESRMA